MARRVLGTRPRWVGGSRPPPGALGLLSASWRHPVSLKARRNIQRPPRRCRRRRRRAHAGPASNPTLPAALLPRLPRRHLVCVAEAAAASASAFDAAAPQPGASTQLPPGARRPRRVCIMVEPSPFTYVCGYMNRYRNTIRFLTEAGVEVMVVTPGPGMTMPGVDFSAACDQVGWWAGGQRAADVACFFGVAAAARRVCVCPSLGSGALQLG